MGSDDSTAIGAESGNDTPSRTEIVIGGAGADTLSGDDLANRLEGGGGNDTLMGGLGSDTFVFNLPTEGMDTITDFSSTEDVLEILASGFGGGLTPGGSVTLLTGADYAAISGASGFFIYDTDGADAGTVYWDADGGSGANATAIARLQGTPGLSITDFDLV